MQNNTSYVINLEPVSEPLEIFDVAKIISETKDKWFNQTLCKTNDFFLRLGIFEGEFHWHKHEKEDEVFFVLEGELLIETENGNFELKKYQGISIPKGVLHRPIALKKTIVLMIEQATLTPTGD